MDGVGEIFDQQQSGEGRVSLLLIQILLNGLGSGSPSNL